MASCNNVANGGDGMGIGKIGSNEIVFKRKFRWTFLVLPHGCNIGVIEPHFVKLASRPNISIEETELNFLNEKTWIAGKASWETITVTYIDVAGTGAGDDFKNLYNWLASVYDFTSNCRHQGSKVLDYTALAVLSLYDGCGKEIEQWQLDNVWPTAINFGDLDYTSSETVDIELTLRYSKVTYESLCPQFTPIPCCSPCT